MKFRPPVSRFDREHSILLRTSIGPPSRAGSVGKLDQYELICQINSGGMGIVYCAVDLSVPKPADLVAIKLLKPELIHHFRARDYFRKEAAHMQNLAHPNILPVLEYKERDKGPYLVMPFIKEGSLHEFARRAPTYEQVYLVIRQIAEALKYAHQRGVSHCDVKPSNILIDGRHQAFLMDFGLSRSFEAGFTAQPEGKPIEGTPQYQSPGTASGEHEDTRGDIYSFGAVLYELLTGSPPYPFNGNIETLRMIREQPPEPILKKNPQAPPELVAVANKAMARSLEHRYAHMSYCCEDLAAITPKSLQSKIKGAIDHADKLLNGQKKNARKIRLPI